MNADEFIRKCTSITGVFLPDAFDVLNEFFSIGKEEYFIDPFKEIDEELAMRLLARLEKGEPSAYIVGHVPFAGIDVEVNTDVLIPRMETEELALYIDGCDGKRVLDLCSGSGCIGLSLAKRFPGSFITLADISERAMEVARRNAKRNGVTNVEFVISDFLDGVEGEYDMVVSNPPYIPEGDEVEADYEPHLALFSGIDGCDSYRRIFKGLPKVLKKDGLCLMELEERSEQILTPILKKQGLFSFEYKKDMSGKTRFLCLRYL